MYKDLIRAEKPIHVTTKDEFKELLSELDQESSWREVYRPEISIAYHSKGDELALGDWLYSDEDTLKKFKEDGGFYLKLNSIYVKGNIPILIDSCAFTMDDRAGAKSRLLSDYLEEGYTEEYASLINEGLKFYQGKIKMLIRGGKLIAMHSEKYHDFSQGALFTLAENHMKAYAESHFLGATYTLEKTTADYAVCGSGDDFFKSYSDAWKHAGMPELMLRECYPVLSFATGDTGKCQVTITPKLYLGSSILPLGSELSIKHTSKLTEENFTEKARLSFASMTEGLSSIEDMIGTKLLHPYAVFVKAATRAGITSKAKTAITRCLETFKDMYDPDTDRISAFDVYYSICEMVHLEEFDLLSGSTKLQVEESLNRLLQIDYRALDYPGREEF